MSIRRLAALLLLVSGVSTACSSTPRKSGPTVPLCGTHGTEQAAADLPEVAAISKAVAALEAKLGGPQDYFEVNATARVVNLFVALNNKTMVQPWAYAGGALSSTEAKASQGGTFRAADLHFDPTKVLSGVHSRLPDATLESFYVLGDSKGNVQYGVLTSSCSGGLDVTVGPDGSVKAVDPVQ
jgi:hypothetical protein